MFADLNDSMRGIGKQSVKALLIRHYKTCNSLANANQYFKYNFVALVAGWAPISCYALYLLLISNARSFILELGYMFATMFIILVLFMAIIIALTDIEAKKGLHFIHGLAFKTPNKRQTFLVF